MSTPDQMCAQGHLHGTVADHTNPSRMQDLAIKDDSREPSREPQQPLDASGLADPRAWHQQSSRALQTFDHVRVDGNSRSHFGNFYQNVYYGTRKRAPSTEDGEVTHTQKTQSPSEEEMLTTLLESLEFDGMQLRLQTISPAHTETCRWIFRTPQYLRWQDDAHRHKNHGLLWIKGHPGSGKSTLMKHVLRVASQNAAAEIIVRFFFDAQAPRVLGKCVEGMYRSLLYQILQARPQLAVGLGMLASRNWPTELLKSMLRDVVRLLKPEDSLTCYVDALDECIEDEIRDAATFFEELGDLAATDNVRFRLCLSSRHFPHITMHKHEELRLDTQEDHLEGIVQYCRTKLSCLDLADSTMHVVLKEIRHRCSGVFFWAALAIKILKERHDRGANRTELMHSLEQVPDGLEQLFARILRNPDGALVACFQWMLFADEFTGNFHVPLPTTVARTYFAVKASIGELVTGKHDYHDFIDTRGMERFIVHSSRGLIEQAFGGFRFIHGSIQGYLRAGGLARLMNIEQSALKGTSHSGLAQSCLAYLQLDAFNYLPGPEQMSTFSQDEFPLLTYARKCILPHMDLAYQEGFLDPETIWRVPLELLVCAMNCRKDEGYDLYRLSNEEVFFNGTATLLYLLTKSHCHGLAKTVLDCRSEAIMNTATNETRANAIFDIDAICDSEQHTALSLAVSQSDVELVRILLDQGAATSGRDQDGYRLRLLEQVMQRYRGVLKSVTTSVEGRVPEHAAERRELLSCLGEIAKLLLDRVAPADEWKGCPLYSAAISSSVELI